MRGTSNIMTALAGLCRLLTCRNLQAAGHGAARAAGRSLASGATCIRGPVSRTFACRFAAASPSGSAFLFRVLRRKHWRFPHGSGVGA